MLRGARRERGALHGTLLLGWCRCCFEGPQGSRGRWTEASHIGSHPRPLHVCSLSTSGCLFALLPPASRGGALGRSRKRVPYQVPCDLGSVPSSPSLWVAMEWLSQLCKVPTHLGPPHLLAALCPSASPPTNSVPLCAWRSGGGASLFLLGTLRDRETLGWKF